MARDTRARLLPGLFVALASCAGHEGGSERTAEPAASASAPAPAAAPKVEAAPPSRPATSKKDDRPRVYAKTRFVWVRAQPSTAGKNWLGFLWVGGSAKLKETEPRYGPGCGTWYAIEPRGFVCVDGVEATLDADDPDLPKLRRYAPNLTTAFPHRYGESRGLRRYGAIPTRAQQKLREYDYTRHLERIERAKGGDVHSSLRGVDLTPAPAKLIDLPRLHKTLPENRFRLNPLSTVAWSAETEVDGRSWLLTADYMWVPKDRVAPYEPVTFQGVELGKDVQLPLAFFRGQDRQKYARSEAGHFTATGDRWARLSWVGLTGRSHDADGRVYLETREAGLWVAKAEAVVPQLAKLTPWEEPVDGSGAKRPPRRTAKKPPEGRRTWIDVSVWKGWLIAYEGTRPVYVTLISPGRGGTPVRGKDPLETASTPTGTFKITGKFATATMVAPHEFIHSDVPWTQNFSGPHALHGAYWHDDWGNRKSAGCINASPIDAKWLYEFTEPDVPPGWHGVRWRPGREPATTLVVRY